MTKDKSEILFVTKSPEETTTLGRKLGAQIQPNSILCFKGELATGKTTFIKGIVTGATSTQEAEIQSPTFTYLHIHEGKVPVYHFDLYRLHNAEEFLSMGFDEFFSANGICCIEWSEKIESLIPENAIVIQMEHRVDGGRNITVLGYEKDQI